MHRQARRVPAVKPLGNFVSLAIGIFRREMRTLIHYILEIFSGIAAVANNRTRGLVMKMVTTFP